MRETKPNMCVSRCSRIGMRRIVAYRKARMSPNRLFLLTCCAFVVSACAPVREPMPITPPGESKGAAVVRRPIAEPATPGTGSASAVAPTARAPASGVVVPAGSLYVCVSENGSARQEMAIQFAPKVAALCAKHPEMGPCQYERDVCRRSGGRVYAAGGVEITQETEAEYDRKVLRVRFKAN